MQIPILIVGGGPAGLCTSIVLSTGAAADAAATLEAVARRVLGYAGHDRGMASYGAGPDRRRA